MEIREFEVWRVRSCNECNSGKEVKELVVKSMVIALCKECRKQLHDILLEEGEVENV